MKKLEDIKEEIKKYVTLGTILKEDGKIHTDMDEEQFSCPFHGADNKPSARYYRSTDTAHCFYCHLSWDVFSYIQKREETSFKEALRLLITKYKIDISKLPEALSDKSKDISTKKVEVKLDNKIMFLLKVRDKILNLKDKIDSDKYIKLVFAYLTLKGNTEEEKFKESALKIKEIVTRLGK